MRSPDFEAGVEFSREIVSIYLPVIRAERAPREGDGLREALGEKRPAPRTEFDNGWNDCRDLVLRLLDAERAPREGGHPLNGEHHFGPSSTHVHCVDCGEPFAAPDPREDGLRTL
jgi:hypothetical protein